MNYIKEINAFYQKQETNQLSAQAANLWHTLMHINNRAGWKTKFTVAATVLCAKANLAATTFKRARKELVEKGYIVCEAQKGNRAAIYHMIAAEEFVGSMVEVDGQDISQEVHQVEQDQVDKVIIADKNVDQKEGGKEPKGIFFAHMDQERTEVSSNLVHKAGPLGKQKETKKGSTTTAAVWTTVENFFKENIGVLSPYVIDELEEWTGKVGELLVLTALKRTVDRGKLSWGYCRAILADWFKKGYQTEADVAVEVVQFTERQLGVGGRHSFRGDWQRDEEEQILKELREEARAKDRLESLQASRKEEMEEERKELAAYG